MTEIDSFDALLTAARSQPEGQRFLLVFVRTELPDDANPEQEKRYNEGHGGALVPVLYTDKGCSEITDFASLVKEAEATGDHLSGKEADERWDIVIVGCLGGYGAREPTEWEAQVPLDEMLRSIRRGNSLMHLAAFDRDGGPVYFQG